MDYFEVDSEKVYVNQDNKDFNNAKNIIFSNDFNDDLFNGIPLLSHSTERITFGEDFNKPLGFDGFGTFLPSNLKILELSGRFNQSIDNLPNGLTNLHFTKNCHFNQPIKKWPSMLEILRFGDKFNTPLFTLPPNLKILEFGDNFNQPIIPLIYPKKLFTISFGNAFNQQIDDLPDSIENIKLGNEFNTEVFYFPRNLKYIEFGKKFNKISTINQLPPSIKKITLYSDFQFMKEVKEKFGEIISIKKYV